MTNVTKRPISLAGSPNIGGSRQFVNADEAEQALTRPIVESNAMANDVNTFPADEDTTIGSGEQTLSNQELDVGELRKKFFNRVKELGRASILGEKSLINLAETLVDGAMQGVFAIDANHVPPINDAKLAYEDFRNPDKGSRRQNALARVETQSEASFKNNVGKLEWFIRLGRDLKHDGIAIKFFNDAKQVHLSMLADQEERKGLKLKATYEAVLHIVRQYLMKQDQRTGQFPAPFTDEEMRDLLRKEEPQAKDGIDLIANAYLELLKAKKGKEPNEKTGDEGRTPIAGPMMDQVLNDIQQLIDHLDGLVPGSGIKHRFNQAVTPKARVGTKKGPPGTNAAQQSGEMPIIDEEFDEVEGEQFDETE